MKVGIFPESKLAHKYCIGRGLEIGGSSHNSFGLDTLNVDLTDSMDTVFKQEEIKQCGKALSVDIVASGDAIPLPDNSQDFIISSHVLEHFSNPIKALMEWDRLLRVGGVIFMIVPHKERTFDSENPRTPLQHLIEDYEKGETESHKNQTGHDHCWVTEDIVELVQWMINALGMKWEIIEIQDQDDKVGNGFTVVIRKVAVTEMKVVFACMINDKLRFDQVLKQSQIKGNMMYIQNPESATKGLNILLDKAEKESADICVLAHQDMYFRSGWVDQLLSQIKMLPESWCVAGVIGKDASGLICGKFHDMRIPDYFNTSDIHSFPHPACCFDEAVIIVNMKKKFRFDESLTGFDLYGTLVVLQAWESGGTSWVIDAFCEHYCMRPFSWVPSQLFIDNYKMLHDRFSAKWNLDSTALGLSPDAEERLEQIKEFMTSAGPEVEQAVA